MRRKATFQLHLWVPLCKQEQIFLILLHKFFQYLLAQIVQLAHYHGLINLRLLPMSVALKRKFLMIILFKAIAPLLQTKFALMILCQTLVSQIWVFA